MCALHILCKATFFGNDCMLRSIFTKVRTDQFFVDIFCWVISRSVDNLSMVLACLAGFKVDMFTCVGWQVTMCDPVWQVMFNIVLICVAVTSLAVDFSNI